MLISRCCSKGSDLRILDKTLKLLPRDMRNLKDLSSMAYEKVRTCSSFPKWTLRVTLAVSLRARIMHSRCSGEVMHDLEQGGLAGRSSIYRTALYNVTLASFKPLLLINLLSPRNVHLVLMSSRCLLHLSKVVLPTMQRKARAENLDVRCQGCSDVNHSPFLILLEQHHNNLYMLIPRTVHEDTWKHGVLIPVGDRCVAA